MRDPELEIKPISTNCNMKVIDCIWLIVAVEVMAFNAGSTEGTFFFYYQMIDLR